MPPRGSVQSCLLEELIHRERLRKWHYHMSDILSLAAQISGNKQTLDKLIDQTSTLYKMEIHAVGAYDSDIEHKTSTEEVKKSDQDLLKILDGLPDV